MRKKTILYYTGNKKRETFSERIRQTLVENSGGLPIISVSQKPIHLGKNICVGEVGASYINVMRQMFIGVENIKTEYIFLAEDDVLYPPEFFQFDPPGGNYYRYENTWVASWHSLFMPGFPANAVVKRDFAHRTLTEWLEGCPEWADGGVKVQSGRQEFMGEPYELFTGPPLIIFKTAGNLSRYGTRHPGTPRHSLHPWGNVNALRQIYDVTRYL